MRAIRGVHSSPGLSVIETLIASAVFLTAIVVLVGLFPASTRAVRQAQGHLMATNLAEREIELSRAMNYDALADRSATYNLAVENNGILNEITFNSEVEVTQVRTGLKQVVVRIDWLGPDYFNRELEMMTYSAQLSP